MITIYNHNHQVVRQLDARDTFIADMLFAQLEHGAYMMLNGNVIRRK